MWSCFAFSWYTMEIPLGSIKAPGNTKKSKTTTTTKGKKFRTGIEATSESVMSVIDRGDPCAHL